MIHIKRLSSDFDHEIRSFFLFQSPYFENHLKKGQTEFFLPESLNQYNNSILKLFFSEFENSSKDNTSINTLSKNDLLQLFELSHFFQVSDFKTKILNILKEKGDIFFFIQNIQEKRIKRVSANDIEQIITETITSENIDFFLKSELHIEFKIRILSKIKPNIFSSKIGRASCRERV